MTTFAHRVRLISAAPVLLLASAVALVPSVTQAQKQKPADVSHEKHQSHDHGGFMQGGKHHTLAKGVALDEKLDEASHTITLREGPIALPAHTDHMKMPQPADLYWSVPFDGWLLGYTPKLVDGTGSAVPGRVLHHVAWWNTNRSDFLCPNKEEHIFGAGGELTNWQEIPGYGYRVQKGDKIRVETMVHNPTDTPYDSVYLEVKIPYAETAAEGANGAAVKSIYPAWMDVQSCGGSGYDLPVGKTEAAGTVPVKFNGVLLGVGGHMHDYAKQLVLQDTTRDETVATLDPTVDEHGRLLSMPVVTFFDKGGYKFAAGDQLKITATYDNTTGKLLPQGAMGIVVGYFAPADDSAMAVLRRKAKSPKREVAGMTHDHHN
jgi:hypothetical protein